MVKSPLIHQLAAEMLHVACACLLLLIRAAMEQGRRAKRGQTAGPVPERIWCMVFTPSDLGTPLPMARRNAVHSIAIAWSFSADVGARLSSRTSGTAASERIIISLKSSM